VEWDFGTFFRHCGWDWLNSKELKIEVGVGFALQARELLVA
jgi:hypothetical protein